MKCERVHDKRDGWHFASACGTRQVFALSKKKRVGRAGKPSTPETVKTRGCHGLVPLEVHGACHIRPTLGARDATGLPRGGFTLAANRRIDLALQTSRQVNLHGASPWHLASRLQFVVAAIVNLQRDKRVASSEFSQSLIESMRENLTHTQCPATQCSASWLCDSRHDES